MCYFTKKSPKTATTKAHAKPISARTPFLPWVGVAVWSSCALMSAQAALPSPFSTGELSADLAQAVSAASQMNISQANFNDVSNPANDMPNTENATPFSLSQAQIDAWAAHTTWRRLLFMPTADKDKAGKAVISSISQQDDPEFFLAPNGSQDPTAELIAMLKAVQNQDEAVLCRLPARAHFIQENLQKLGINTPELACAEFDAWADLLGGHGLSLVFAEEHGNSLASAFAHVFMRVDKDGSTDTATAINYTVAPNRRDSQAEGAIKSMLGSYDGVMEIMPFAKKASDYLHTDGRDLWVYRLNLNDDELRQVLRHIYEVQSLQRPYFFTHDNCATEIVRLIDLVRPDENLRKQVGKIVIPSQIARIMDQEGIIISREFMPSDTTKKQAAINKAYTNGEDIRPLLAQPLANFRDVSVARPSNNDAAKSSPVYRLGLGAGVTDFADKAHHQPSNTKAIISVRSAYQDALDRPAGVRQFHALSLPSMTLSASDGDVSLDELTIFSVRSYNPANTAKNNATINTANTAKTATPADDKPKSASAWGQHLRLMRVMDASSAANDNHLVLDVRLEKGKSWTLGQGAAGTGMLGDTLCYALIGYGAQLGKLNQGYRVGGGLDLGCVYQPAGRWRALGELSLPVWYHHDKADVSRDLYVQPKLSVGAQFDINARQALRMTGDVEWGKGDTQQQLMAQWLTYF
ncbi:hypothetical protein B0181_01225 [Moraxella caviae]|uniref:Uncharacterized protein n=1 Tax=Moraxella caviae TaxID=34060 RepID=A0A1T0AAQ1_9GAMM|nr:DUF4105 domain-containing protein [Moraxella caviae]OOR92785.1 hypothetical protein B0181_01225 [Moraxella caviae]STZ14179.1 Uncharacterised protein [Moraxella caviae]VEW12625.1 Uncharacterised protein [Moraxella caviae]